MLVGLIWTKPIGHCTFLSGPGDLSKVPERGSGIEKRKRQETEDRAGAGLSMNTNSLEFISHHPFVPKAKGEGKRLPSHDTRNKQAEFPP